MLKKILFFCLITIHGIQAQQEMLFSRYMFDGITINPAYAGSHEAFSTTLLVRERWAEMRGAPSTMMLSGHSPISKSFATGFLIVRDKLGVNERLGFHAMGAYRMNLTPSYGADNKGVKLAFGLQMGTINSRYNYDELTPKDPYDVILSEGNARSSTLSIGTGGYLYAQNWYIGVAIPRISLATFGLGAKKIHHDANQTLLLNTGYVFKLNRAIKVKPNFLVRFQEGMIYRYDINLNVLLKNLIWVGASYRSRDSINLLAQLQLTPQLQLAYAYDAYLFSKRKDFTTGSHELSINYRFSFFNVKVVEPTLF